MTTKDENKQVSPVTPMSMDIQNSGIDAKVSVGFNCVKYSYQGPIPQAEELGRYNMIVPGAAERIIKMAEEEQQIEKIRGEQDYRIRKYGIVTGFFGYICALILVGFALWLDKNWVAGAFVAMFSVCAIFAQAGNKDKDTKKK